MEIMSNASFCYTECYLMSPRMQTDGEIVLGIMPLLCSLFCSIKCSWCIPKNFYSAIELWLLIYNI